MTKPFETCPVCGGELIEKRIEKLVRGGDDVAAVNVDAEVCLKCGECLYSQETVQRFEQIRTKLKKHDVGSFRQLGQAYLVT